MRALFIEHDHSSPPGPVAERFADHGYDIVEKVVVPAERFTTPNVEFEFPDPSNYDVLVPMGAPWGAWNDDQIGTWLGPELEWLRAADRLGIPVLGICFGGQTLARAHGGTVFRGPRPEIGWSTVWSEIPELSGRWFQFHYDQWTTPPEATPLAQNALAPQAFSLRNNLALQFHPEVTSETLQGWIDNGGRPQLENDGQDPDFLLRHLRELDQESRARAHALVDYFLTNYR